jgi:hypothetical protein
MEGCDLFNKIINKKAVFINVIKNHCLNTWSFSRASVFGTIWM